ncbi:MAG: hypothetical protein CVU71_10185 [Deltaproteobacteria bacterium HGW-Deltaproteobacteria-6]|jgi:mono/diheme cytochrome c family protein|nr:MAG: hypothetical protein CVU71_10185 [Deltaproteobacteria bacterium HGW-Deltaproteobacteria-6]
MKKIWSLLLITIFAMPVAGFADPKVDFNAKCAKCHRTNKNILKQAKLLNVHPEKLTLRTSKMTRDEMIAITEKGKDKMPGFEKDLTRQQIEDIIEYILALKNRSVPPGR